ncbi:MAG: rhodanese-like domain-containing protein [Ruminococcus sp.]|nr:rhodanese-like domain-containing protein [Ruminococcus sp.]
MKRYTVVSALMLGMLLFSGCSEGASPGSKAPEVTDRLTEPSAEVSSTAPESAAPAAYRQISQDEAKEMMSSGEGYIILDVRRQDEFDAGHIPGAICVPNETIESEPPAELPDRAQVILVYCRSGRRSKEAAQKLADMGYTSIYEFGGINSWTGDVVTEEGRES